MHDQTIQQEGDSIKCFYGVEAFDNGGDRRRVHRGDGGEKWEITSKVVRRVVKGDIERIFCINIGNKLVHILIT